MAEQQAMLRSEMQNTWSYLYRQHWRGNERNNEITMNSQPTYTNTNTTLTRILNS